MTGSIKNLYHLMNFYEKLFVGKNGFLDCKSKINGYITVRTQKWFLYGISVKNILLYLLFY